MTITDAMVEAALLSWFFHNNDETGARMRAALEAAYPQGELPELTRLIEEKCGSAVNPAFDKIRVALEKARRLHQIDCADHNVGLFIDEALSWLSPPPVPDHTGSNKNTDRA